MGDPARDATGSNREAKTWLMLALGGVALMMFAAGFVLVIT